jgi:hypothetical protein
MTLSRNHASITFLWKTGIAGRSATPGIFRSRIKP